jgi:hypothetical protein
MKSPWHQVAGKLDGIQGHFYSQSAQSRLYVPTLMSELFQLLPIETIVYNQLYLYMCIAQTLLKQDQIIKLTNCGTDRNKYLLGFDFPVEHLEFVLDRCCLCFPLTFMGYACQSIGHYYLSKYLWWWTDCHNISHQSVNVLCLVWSLIISVILFVFHVRSWEHGDKPSGFRLHKRPLASQERLWFLKLAS